MTDTPNTDQPLDLDAIEARVATVAKAIDGRPDTLPFALLDAHADRAALTAEVRKLREALAPAIEFIDGMDTELGLTLGDLWERSTEDQRKTIQMNWPKWKPGDLSTGSYDGIISRLKTALGDPS